MIPLWPNFGARCTISLTESIKTFLSDIFSGCSSCARKLSHPHLPGVVGRCPSVVRAQCSNSFLL